MTRLVRHRGTFANQLGVRRALACFVTDVALENIPAKSRLKLDGPNAWERPESWARLLRFKAQRFLQDVLVGSRYIAETARVHFFNVTHAGEWHVVADDGEPICSRHP